MATAAQSGQQCSVIRVDKKTSLLVYRDASQGSILQNASDVSSPSQSFTSTLKSIFSPQTANIFSAEQASAKANADRKKILGQGGSIAPARPNPVLDRMPSKDRRSVASEASGSTSSVDKSPKIAFAPLPEPDVGSLLSRLFTVRTDVVCGCQRPRGRSSSISCGVANRAAMLRGDTPSAPVKQPEIESAVVEPEEDDGDEECEGRAMCRNSTITKNNPGPASTANPVLTPKLERRASTSATEESTSEDKSRWSEKLKRPFSKRRSSSTGSGHSSVSNGPSSNLRAQPLETRKPNVVYEIVSNEEAESYLRKGAAERGTTDLKVVHEQPEPDQWIEEAVDYSKVR